jgi:hypothetical protein
MDLQEEKVWLLKDSRSRPESLLSAQSELPDEQITRPLQSQVDLRKPFIQWPSFIRKYRTLAILKFRGLVNQEGTHRLWPNNARVKVIISADANRIVAKTLEQVRKHADVVPVDETIVAFVHRGFSYTVTQSAKGEQLLTAWGDLSDEDRGKVVLQLLFVHNDLRSMIRPSHVTGISNIEGGPLQPGRMLGRSGTESLGPFVSGYELERYLKDNCRVDTQFLEALTSEMDGRQRPAVFTHGAFAPRNILVRGADVVGITGWEAAGFYPPAWESLSARWLLSRDCMTQTHIDRIISPVRERRGDLIEFMHCLDTPIPSSI